MDPQLAALFNRFGTAKPLKDRMVFIGPGRHVLALVSFGPKNTDKGLIIAWKLLVIESSFHQPGSIVDASVRLYEPEPWKREQEEARGAEFVRQLADPHADPGKLVQLSAALASPAQSGRGLMVIAHGTSVPKKNPKPGKDPNFTDVRWEHLPNQAPEQIAKLRAHIESTVSGDVLNPATVAPPPPAYPPAGYAAPAAAPVGYAAPVAAPAGYPPPAYPGGYPPAAAPQPAAAAPTGYGAPATPPMYPGGYPPAAPPAAPQPAAAPNFLAGILGGR